MTREVREGPAAVVHQGVRGSHELVVAQVGRVLVPGGGGVRTCPRAQLRVLCHPVSPQVLRRPAPHHHTRQVSRGRVQGQHAGGEHVSVGQKQSSTHYVEQTWKINVHTEVKSSATT